MSFDAIMISISKISCNIFQYIQPEPEALMRVACVCVCVRDSIDVWNTWKLLWQTENY